MSYRRVVSYLALSGALGAFGVGAAAPQPESALRPELSQLAERFNKTVLSCPERLWPSPWHDFRIVFVLRRDRTGVLLARSQGGPWSASPVSLERDEFRPLADVAGEYAILRTTPPTVAVFMTDLRSPSLYRSVELAAHEGFHAAGQRAFAKVGRMDRGREVPSDWTYSYARVMLLQRLQQSYRTLAPLGRPAFWYRYATEERVGARADASRLLDRLEGSAQFVGIVAIALYQAGCTASDRDLRRIVFRSFNQRWEATRYANLSPDAPAYVIGLIAGLLLDATGHGSWKQQVESGASPADLLLAGQTPEHDEGDPQLRASIRESLARQDEAYLPRLKGLAARVAAGDDYVVAMAWTRLLNVGAFNPSTDLISLKEDSQQGRFFLLGVRGRFPYEGSRTRVELRGQDVMEEAATPCGAGARWVFPVPRASVAHNLQGASVASDTAIVSGAARPQSRWLCLD